MKQFFAAFLKALHEQKKLKLERTLNMHRERRLKEIEKARKVQAKLEAME